MKVLALALCVAFAGFGCGSSGKPGSSSGAGGRGGTGGGSAGSSASGAAGSSAAGSGAAGSGAAGTAATGAAGSGAAGTGAAGSSAAGTGAAGSSVAGTGAAGTVAGPDPYVPLPAAEAPLARGTWVDRTPCRWLPAVPAVASIAHDASGRLFTLAGGRDSADVDMNLFEWDHAARHFWNRTACKPESTWPVLRRLDAFGYDPATDALVVAGESPLKEGYLTVWRRPPTAGTWTRTSDTVYWRGFFGVGNLWRDEKRKSLILSHDDGLLELADGTTSWKDQFSTFTPTMFPPPQWDNLHIYDPSRGTAVRVASLNRIGETIQTWEYSLTAHDWMNRTPAQSPADLKVVHGWWNPVSQRASILAFSAADLPGPMSVWEWNAAAGAWSQLAPAPGSPVPPFLFVTSSSFDATRGRLVVATQTEHGVPGLWAWTVATKTWTRLSPERWGALWPYTLAGAVTYDIVRRRTVVVSLDPEKAVEVLEWDGAAAKFDDLHVAGASPWPLLTAGMLVAYDGHRQRVLVYGYDDGGSRALWEWDGAAKRWTDRSSPEGMPDVRPPASARPLMAYDAKRRRLVLLGVRSSGWEVWEWDPIPGTWQERAVPAEVSTRIGNSNAVAVYDEARGRTVFASSPSHLAEWDGTTWTVPTIADVQTVGRMVATYDPRRARTMFMTLDAPKVLLSWDGQRLVNETPAGLAAANINGQAFDSALVYDRRRGNLMVIAPQVEPDFAHSRQELMVWEGSTAP